MNSSFQQACSKNLRIPQSFILLSLSVFLICASWLIANPAGAESQSRTESNCTIGMVKGEQKSECHVPIIDGCTVAQFPGYDEPWAEASKGGATSCQFDEKKTDWKTSIVGSCKACKTEQCTGRFIVMFDCSGKVPSVSPAFPQQR